ncbi:hypothetical protein B0H14DRAFT_3891920 [Mycena olivaceomarginata]|nr:hypothetical protein B0H14DRAFT_3891920 [Mycena olivaceomarginata]
MSSSDHSMISYEKQGLIYAPSGSHKVKYTGDNWDFHLDIPTKAVDLSLVLPHYPQPMKLKVYRSYYHAKFEMEVRASTSDITIWLPSDFKGVIHCPKATTFSAGFVNRIMGNVRLNDLDAKHVYDEDEVIVSTSGRVQIPALLLRAQAPETASHDWDFLLED